MWNKLDLSLAALIPRFNGALASKGRLNCARSGRAGWGVPAGQRNTWLNVARGMMPSPTVKGPQVSNPVSPTKTFCDLDKRNLLSRVV